MKKYWKSIKEHRGEYFVEYTPASDSIYLATVVLIYVDIHPSINRVIEDVEREFNEWIEIYPIPIMASAVDVKQDGIVKSK